MNPARGLIPLLLLLIPSIAIAATGVPDPAQCLFPEVIVGASPAAPCPVLVRDSGGNPIEGAMVELRFGPAIPYGVDLHLWDMQIPPATYSCATNSISLATNAFGLALFDPLFGGHVNEARVEVLADGVFLGVAKARSTDYDGNGMCCIIDLAWLRYYYWHEPDAEHSDFNNNGSVDLGDLDVFRRGYFGPYIAPVCP